jgi:rhamnogalacturonan endolyase
MSLITENLHNAAGQLSEQNEPEPGYRRNERSAGKLSGWAVTVLGLLGAAGWAGAARQMEALDRGLVAVRSPQGQVLVSWRWLGNEPEAIAFDVYRSIDGAAPVKLNPAPITQSTCWLDAGADPNRTNTYFVQAILRGQAQPLSRPFLLPPHAPPYLAIPLRTPAGYHPNDASVGDLDGDGTYEIVLHQVGQGRDNAQTGLTTPPILDAYKLDGTLLWRINLGKNIREGPHYTPFIVFDLDGDGRAELACRTADGTVDGRGQVIGDPAADWRDTNRFSSTFGKILRGPEFLTIFDGRTGAALYTTNYLPPRGELGGWGGVGGNGGNDTNGNRADRFLACVAYLDGQWPSLVMCRGYYGRSVLAAWDWRQGQLRLRWLFDSQNATNPFSGQGGHQLTVADVDGDGRDEIIYHAMVVDDDGRGLFSTGLRHGDALHVSDFDPNRPGLEVFSIHENEGPTVRLGTPGTACYDARTGQILWSHGPGVDVERGLAADIDPRYPGAEMWTGPAGLRTCRGQLLGPAPRTANFAIWWDGDLLRELLDGVRVWKWDWTNSQLRLLLDAAQWGCAANNGSKNNPCLTGDLLGDWREEILLRNRDGTELRLFTTWIPTGHRLRTLMHNPQYRLSVAWQNVGYNQPPHPSYFLGAGMKPPPQP